MTRDRLRGVLDAIGVPTAGQALVHILYRATLDGLIVRGPMVGSEHAFVPHNRYALELRRRVQRGPVSRFSSRHRLPEVRSRSRPCC